MNVTLSIDEKVVQHAREVARSMGVSLNQLIRDYLLSITAPGDAESDIHELKRLSRKSGGRMRRWRFDRDELHERT